MQACMHACVAMHENACMHACMQGLDPCRACMHACKRPATISGIIGAEELLFRLDVKIQAHSQKLLTPRTGANKANPSGNISLYPNGRGTRKYSPKDWPYCHPCLDRKSAEASVVLGGSIDPTKCAYSSQKCNANGAYRWYGEPRCEDDMPCTKVCGGFS